MTAEKEENRAVPLYGKDEMNLIEFPFGPISSSDANTLEAEHPVYDKQLRKVVIRKLILTGSDAFGLPRPIDEQVLLGMKTLTHEAGATSRTICFSRYHLCRTIGWKPDGRAYRRLEESFDRIAGSTLKFKDAWWDKGESEWKSKTFHLIEEVDLCSRDRLDRARLATGRSDQQLCSFVWSEVVWKSFTDGFIRTIDMQLFRRIAKGRRREVPVRLFRILDKRFYHDAVAKFNLNRLCIGTLGLCSSYSPSQMIRVLNRAAACLTDCEYLDGVRYSEGRGGIEVFFRRRLRTARKYSDDHKAQTYSGEATRERALEIAKPDRLKQWLSSQNEVELLQWEVDAIASRFGSEFERRLISDERAQGLPLMESGRLRHEYLRRFVASRLQPPGIVEI